MSKQVAWTKAIIDAFCQDALLSSEERWILMTRASGMSIVEQSMKLNKSESSINRIISRLKKKYDKVQPFNPILPKRTFNSCDTYK